MSAEFEKAMRCVVEANPEELQALLDQHPDLVTQRSTSEHHSTLLHYLAANGIEDEIQLDPKSAYQRIQKASEPEASALRKKVLAVATLLLDRGAGVDATCDTYGGGPQQTTLNLLVSSAHPMEAKLCPDLTDLLCQRGANPDGLLADGAPLSMTVLGGALNTAKVLIRHGAPTDNILFAAVAGDAEQIRAYLDHDPWQVGNLDRMRQPWFDLPDDPKALARRALDLAIRCGHQNVIQVLQEAGVQP